MSKRTAPLSIVVAVLGLVSAAILAAEKHEGKVVEAGDGKLVMTDTDGTNQHAHTVPTDATITLDGKTASLDDLKKGITVEISTDKKNGDSVVTRIVARSAKSAFPTRVRKDQDVSSRSERPGSVVTRASKMLGATVKNPSNENLGKIEDVVIDIDQGSVKYAVLSFGGVLGIGDKLFAIPWRALSIQEEQGSDNFWFVLKVDKERLEKAPGFNQNQWPERGSPKWAEVDTFYRDDDSLR
jgi:sporulation protein YlmC with PRC-barrel domain